MNLKKGIRLIAWGLILTLVNINVSTGNRRINITPDFIGWLLIAIGCGKLGNYAKRKSLYIFFAVVLSICEAAFLVLGIVFPKKDFGLYVSGLCALEDLYVIFLLSLLGRIAERTGYDHYSSIRTLKYIYIIISIIYIALTLAVEYLPLQIYVAFAAADSIMALLAAILTCIIMMRFARKIETE